MVPFPANGDRPGVRYLLLALFLLGPLPFARAATETVPSYAQLAFPLENQGGSARAIAMGSAFVAVGGDVSALSWNPAGLSSLSSFQLALHHNFYLQDWMQDTLVFATPKGSLGSWGLSVSYLNYGSLTGRDASGTVTGNFSAGRWGGEIAWASTLLQGFSLGLGLKGNLLSLSSNAYTNVAGDLGVEWEASPSLRLGAAYSNWGTDAGTYIANSVLRLGGAYDWKVDGDNQALLAASLSWEPYGVTRLDLGAEDVILSFLALRVGYVASLAATDLQGLTGLAAGLGLSFQDLRLDYAYSPFGDLGSSQRISLTYDFGGPAASKPSPASSTVPPVKVATPAPSPVQPTPTPKPEGQKLKLLFSLPSGSQDDAAGQDPDWDRKVQGLKDAIALKPRNGKAWSDLGKLYYQKGLKADAAQCFEQALRLEPHSAPLKAWLSKCKAVKP